MDQSQKFALEYVYPPQPFTERGLPSKLDSNSKKIVYCVSNIVVVRNTDDLTVCGVFDQHKFETTAIRISPSGNLCASADNRGNLFIWEINTPGFPVSKSYENVLGGSIRDICWTNDNQRIAVAGEGKTFFAKAILLDTGSSLGDIGGLARPIFAADMRPQRPFRLAVAGEEFLTAFYEGPPFKFKKSSKQHANYVYCLRYNPNGEFFVTGSSDRKLFLYEGKDGNELKEIKSANPHTRTVTGVTWLDDTSFATSSNDTTVKIWTVNDEENLVKTLRVAEKPHEIEEMQVAIAQSNGDLFAVSLFGCLNQWKDARNLAEGSLPTARYQGHQSLVGQVIEDKAHNLIISGDNNGKILIWDGKNAILPEGQGHSKAIQGLALSQDSSRVYSLGGEELRVLNIESRTYEKSVECKGQSNALLASTTEPTTVFVLFENGLIQKYVDLAVQAEFKLGYDISCFAISQGDQYLFVGDLQGNVHQLETEGGKEVHKFTMYGTRITTITASRNADKNWVVVGDSTGKIRLWDYEAKTELTGDRWVHHTTIISSLSFSPSYKQVVSTGQDNKFIVYDTTTYVKLAEQLNAHRRGILNGLVSSTGKIITTGGDNAVKVWQPAGFLE